MRRVRRWIIIAAVLLLAVFVAAGVGLRVFLASDAARRMLVEQVERRTMLRVAVDTMRVGLTGRTVLENVSVALPLADKPLLTAKTVTLDHSAAWAVLWPGLEVQSVQLTEPVLDIRQDDSGRWNLGRLADLLGRAASGPAGDGRLPRPPRVLIEQGRAVVTDARGRSVTHQGLAVSIEPLGAGIVKLEADARTGDGATRLAGRAAIGGDWRHELEFSTTNLAALLEPVWVLEQRPVTLRGRWAGEVKSDALTGRLTLDEAHLPVEGRRLAVVGAALASLGDGRVTLRPDALRVQWGEVTVLLRDGAVTLDPADQTLTMDALTVRAFDGSVRLAGSWRLRQNVGEVDAVWSDVIFPERTRHDGSLWLALTAPGPGRRAVEAHLRLNADSPVGDLQALVTLDARGAGVRELAGKLRIERLRASRDERVLALADTTLDLALDWPTLELRELDNAAVDADVHGQVNLQTLAWQFAAEAARFSLPVLEPIGPVRLKAVASGSARDATIQALTLAFGSLTATATGRVEFDEHATLGAMLTVKSVPVTLGGRDDAVLGGRDLVAHVSLDGSLSPLDLSIEGEAGGASLTWGKADLGPVSGRLTGRLTEEQFTVRTDQVALLNGSWRFGLEYDTRRRHGEVTVQAQGVPLHHIDSLLDEPTGLAGLVGLELSVAASDGSGRQDAGEGRIVGRGRFTVEPLAYRELTAQRASGQIVIRDHFISLRDVKLEHRGGGATVRADLLLNEPRRVEARWQIDNWPVDLPRDGLLAQVGGSGRLQLELADLSGVGDGRVRVALLDGQRELATLDAQAALDGRTVTVSQLTGRAAGADVRGQGVVRLDELHRSTATLTCQGLELQQLARFFAPLEDSRGSVSFALSMQPETDPRALGQTRLDMGLSTEDATFRGVQIGPAHGSLFLSPRRAVLDGATLQVAAGTLKLWGRISRREQGPFVYLRSEFEDLSLDQIVLAAAPDSDKMSGRLSGRATVTAQVGDTERLFGLADVRLSESDLANSNVFALLYQTLNLQIGGREPSGRGRAVVRIEGPSLVVESARYTNRGVDVRMNGRVQDVTLGRQSPFSGVAIASTNPLPDLPVLRELDDPIKALQSATAVRFSGTLAEPTRQIVTMQELSLMLRSLLGGESGE